MQELLDEVLEGRQLGLKKLGNAEMILGTLYRDTFYIDPVAAGPSPDYDKG